MCNAQSKWVADAWHQEAVGRLLFNAWPHRVVFPNHWRGPVAAKSDTIHQTQANVGQAFFQSIEEHLSGCFHHLQEAQKFSQNLPLTFTEVAQDHTQELVRCHICWLINQHWKHLSFDILPQLFFQGWSNNLSDQFAALGMVKLNSPKKTSFSIVCDDFSKIIHRLEWHVAGCENGQLQLSMADILYHSLYPHHRKRQCWGGSSDFLLVFLSFLMGNYSWEPWLHDCMTQPTEWIFWSIWCFGDPGIHSLPGLIVPSVTVISWPPLTFGGHCWYHR